MGVGHIRAFIVSCTAAPSEDVGEQEGCCNDRQTSFHNKGPVGMPPLCTHNNPPPPPPHMDRETIFFALLLFRLFVS